MLWVKISIYVHPFFLFSLGGIGEAVAAAVSGEPGILVQSLAVSGVPRSGKPAELLDLFGISAKHIITAVKSTFANWFDRDEVKKGYEILKMDSEEQGDSCLVL